MEILHHFFYFPNDPPSDLTGTYNPLLVILSYLIASFASYVALDIAKNLRNNEGATAPNKWWLLGGAITLGAGIWTMHFVGMQAFNMPMPMSYDLVLTVLSLIIAIIASGIAFTLVTMNKGLISLILGGIVIGLGISSMHYVGMSAMLHMKILYTPGFFVLSILIAIAASLVALWAMLRSQSGISLNIVSAFILGAAISGMHYLGMTAAVFYPEHDVFKTSEIIKPDILSFYIASMTVLIMGIALLLSIYRQYNLTIQTKINQELQSKELILQRQQRELSNINRELVDREKKTRAILTTAADAIITADENEKIQTFNPAAEAMFEYSEQECKNKEIQSLLHPLNQENISLHSLVANHPHNLELIGIPKSGKSFPLELSVSKLSLTQGVHFVLILRNITERKTAEKKLADLNHELMGIARKAGKVEIINSILHNVGNVLNSVNISTSILKEQLTHSKMFSLEEAAELLEKHQENLPQFLTTDTKGKYFKDFICLLAKSWKNEFSSHLQELTSLTNKIDHMKHIIRSQQTFESKTNFVEKISLSDLIRDAINMSNLNTPDLTLQVDCHDDVHLYLDKAKLLQILINVLQNANEALTENNVIGKQISIKTEVSKNQNLIIEIRDNGIGISEKDLENIFKFGFSTKPSGHGFGLHASALAAREMNGSLSAKSEGKGKGAVFILELPIKE